MKACTLVQFVGGMDKIAVELFGDVVEFAEVRLFHLQRAQDVACLGSHAVQQCPHTNFVTGGVEA